MLPLERVWSTAHEHASCLRWEIFQLAAVLAGAIAIARTGDRRLLCGYATGIVAAVIGAIALGNGAEWASFAARGAHGPPPELEIAGLGAIAGLVIGYVTIARGGERGENRAWLALDALAPAVAAMIALARLGCFFAGCDFGSPTAVPWALRYPHHTPAFRAQLEAGLVHTVDPHTLPVHPTQLYESLLGLVVLAIAVAWPRSRWGLRRGANDGERFGVVLLCYLVGRFAIDFVRGDLARGALGLTVTQWISIAIAGAIVAAWCSRISARVAASRHRDDPPSSPGSRRSSRPTAFS